MQHVQHRSYYSQLSAGSNPGGGACLQACQQDVWAGTPYELFLMMSTVCTYMMLYHTSCFTLPTSVFHITCIHTQPSHIHEIIVSGIDASSDNFILKNH
jgi:hypothetical protein